MEQAFEKKPTANAETIAEIRSGALITAQPPVISTSKRADVTKAISADDGTGTALRSSEAKVTTIAVREISVGEVDNDVLVVKNRVKTELTEIAAHEEMTVSNKKTN